MTLGRFLHHLTKGLIDPCCSCLVPVFATDKANHGVPLEDQRQRSPMVLFRPPRGRHCSRYVGESRSPLPSTPRAHLAASALSLRLVIVQGLCVGAVATDQRAHLLEDARAWRASPRVGPCRVLPPQRVGVRLSLLRGRQNRDARLGLNSLFVFLQMGYASRARVKSSANGCMVCFRTTVYPTPRGTLP